MNAPLFLEVRFGLDNDQQTHLELSTEGLLRYFWESRWGAVLIEARDGRTYVNGQPVESFAHD